jgi:hypothetical protein
VEEVDLKQHEGAIRAAILRKYPDAESQASMPEGAQGAPKLANLGAFFLKHLPEFLAFVEEGIAAAK